MRVPERLSSSLQALASLPAGIMPHPGAGQDRYQFWRSIPTLSRGNILHGLSRSASRHKEALIRGGSDEVLREVAPVVSQLFVQDPARADVPGYRHPGADERRQANHRNGEKGMHRPREEYQAPETSCRQIDVSCSFTNDLPEFRDAAIPIPALVAVSQASPQAVPVRSWFVSEAPSFST